MFRPDIDLEMEKSILSLWRFTACPAMQNILNVPVTGIALQKREVSLYALRRHIQMCIRDSYGILAKNWAKNEAESTPTNVV